MEGGIWVIKERWDGFAGVTVTVAVHSQELILAHSHHALISPSTHTSTPADGAENALPVL